MGGYRVMDGEFSGKGMVFGMPEQKEEVHHYHHKASQENTSMNGDIAGLLALMQGNKGMDLPGLLALCKDKGYANGFGGDGAFLWAFLLLFLFANGGWGGMSPQNRQAFAEAAGSNCSQITGLYDRIYAAQSESATGFLNLDTKLCSSIASVIDAVRNQGDRVADMVSACCCKMEAQMSTILCEISGLSRDVRDVNNNLSAKIELEALKQETARAAMECRIGQKIDDCCCSTTQQIAELRSYIATNRLEDENARLHRKVEELSDILRGNRIADAAVAQLQNFALTNYTPTRTATAPAA